MSASLLGLLVASSCGAGVDVRVASDRTLDVEAKSASVSSVLECLSEKAGFKMVIEPGLAMRQSVTISLSRRTPTQAVIGVLDGQGLNYAYTSDPSGSRVLMLLISGRSDRTPAKGTTTTPAGVPDGRPASRREPRIAPPEPEPKPPGEPPNDRLPGNAPPVLLPFFPPDQPQLYPEARPLSPLSLRDARQIHIALSRPARSPGTATDTLNRARR